MSARLRDSCSHLVSEGEKTGSVEYHLQSCGKKSCAALSVFGKQPVVKGVVMRWVRRGRRSGALEGERGKGQEGR